MPISRINPDGSVKIYNKNTGEVKDVSPDELASYNPKLIGEYQEMLVVQQAKQASQNLVKQGQIDFQQYAQQNPTEASQLLESGFIPKTQEEIQREQQKSKARPDAESLFQGLEELKTKAEDASLLDALASRVSGGNIGTDAAIFDQSKKLLGQSVAKLYESGRLSDKDREFYQNEILKLSSVGRKGAIEAKINNLQNEILRKAGFSREDIEGDQTDNKQEAQKSGSNFFSNVASDTKNILNSILGLPAALSGQAVELQKQYGTPNQLLLKDPKKYLDIMSQSPRGAIQEYNELLGKPLEGGDIVGRASQRAYEKPVTTFLDVLPFLQAGKASSVSKAIPDEIAPVVKAVESPTTGKQLASKMYANLFEISKNKGTRGLNPQQIGQKMADYGITANSYDELGQIAKTVTGDTGILNKAKREAIAGLNNVDIDLGTVYGTVRKEANKIPGFSDKKSQSFARSVFKTGVSDSGEIGKMNALDAFSVEKELEALASDYYREWLQNKSVISKKQYQAYKSGANEIGDVLDKQTKLIGIENVKTPESIQQLSQISPKLAQDFINAKTVSDIRKLEAPFVGISRAVEETALNQGRIMKQAGANLGSRVGGAVAGGSFGGPLGAILGYGLGPTIEPVLSAASESLRVPLTTRAARAALGFKKPSIPGVPISKIQNVSSATKTPTNVTNLLRLLGINQNQ